MALITLTGGALWQWDTSRSVAVAGDAAVEVHFALEGAGEAYCTEVSDGLAEIPNVLLVAGRDIVAWASDGENTLGMVRLAVHRRAKPPTYAYSATEIKSVESIAGDVVATALASLSYNDLNDLPTIEEVQVVGDLLLTDFGLERIEDEEITEAFEAAI